MSSVSVVEDLDRYQPAVDLLKALAAPVRLALLDRLSGGPRCVHELVGDLGAPQPLVSQHLRLLRLAGLVTCTRRGKEVQYALVDEHVARVLSDVLRHAAEPVPPSPEPSPDPVHEEEP